MVDDDPFQTLSALIASELATVSDSRVIAHVRNMLIEPHVLLRTWNYGPNTQYPCWFVLKDEQSGAEIAYCEYGFGPRCPWGLVSSGIDDSMGMDSGWFQTFLDAFFDSFASCALPIWKIVKVGPDGSATAVTDEGGWGQTWSSAYALRESDPTTRYNVRHSISYGRST